MSCKANQASVFEDRRSGDDTWVPNSPKANGLAFSVTELGIQSGRRGNAILMSVSVGIQTYKIRAYDGSIKVPDLLTAFTGTVTNTDTSFTLQGLHLIPSRVFTASFNYIWHIHIPMSWKGKTGIFTFRIHI